MEPQVGTRNDITGCRHVRLIEVADRGAKEHRDRVIPPVRRVDDGPRGHHGVFGMK